MSSVRWGDRIGMALLGLLVFSAVFAPLLAPYGPITPSPHELTPPFTYGHLLGTDEVGYDILSRILYGLRSSILGSLVVVSAGVFIGALIGVSAGTLGGGVDRVLMRFTDLCLSLPAALMAIAVVAALGPSYLHTLIGVGVVWWPLYARITRAEITKARGLPHFEAAQLSGIGKTRLALRHLFPAAAPAIVTAASLDVGNVVITLAQLSFLGLGTPAPAPELGAMSSAGLTYLAQQWWVSIMPSIAVLLLAFSANLSGDAINDMRASR